jgi:hypothetical protein
MKKKIILIVLGSLFAVVALLAVLFYLRAPSSAFPGAAPRMARAPSATAASKLRAGTATWMPQKKKRA